jgi:hypothetical protein
MAERERYGMNMSQAEQDRVAWVVMGVLYALLPLPLGLLLIWAGLSGGVTTKAIGIGLCFILGPIADRRIIHEHFSPRRAR